MELVQTLTKFGWVRHMQYSGMVFGKDESPLMICFNTESLFIVDKELDVVHKCERADVAALCGILIYAENIFSPQLSQVCRGLMNPNIR